MMHDPLTGWLMAGLAIVAFAALAVALWERDARRLLEDGIDQRVAGVADAAYQRAGSGHDDSLRSDCDELLKKRGEDLRRVDDLEKLVECRRKDLVALSYSCSTWHAQNHALHKKHETAFQEFLLSSGMKRETEPAIPEEQILVIKGAVPEHDVFKKLTQLEKRRRGEALDPRGDREAARRESADEGC